MKRPNKHVFAVIRIDEFQPSDVPWENRVTVKEIVMEEQEARAEVQRLNSLSKGKDRIYFWQLTRLIIPNDKPVN